MTFVYVDDKSHSRWWGWDYDGKLHLLIDRRCQKLHAAIVLLTISQNVSVSQNEIEFHFHNDGGGSKWCWHFFKFSLVLVLKYYHGCTLDIRFFGSNVEICLDIPFWLRSSNSKLIIANTVTVFSLSSVLLQKVN